MKKCIKCEINQNSNLYYYNWNVCNLCKSKQAKLRNDNLGSNGWLSSKYFKIKGHAKRRKKHFSLDKDVFKQIMSSKKCSYCKCKLTHKIITLDRLDNSIGYTNDNCYACCMSCNRIKWSSSLNDIKNIYFGMKRLLKTKKQPR